uniref:G-protein coupled receptors family 1 profile domain-containing protein n=1 Tax=Meloidogyne javanica TaxID=6303 RepID=A0A915LWT2_MELJA
MKIQNCTLQHEWMALMDDLLLAASTGSTLFNLLVIFCAFRLFKRSGDTMHVFIINMTFGDLLLTVFCHPNEFLIRKHAFLRHVHLCAIIHYCNWLGLAVSGLSLTLLNVDKLIYFRWPLSYERAMSKRRAVCLCVGVWGVSLGFVSYVWLENIVFVTTDCMLQMADNSKYFYEIFMILFCVLPVSSSLVVSTYLFRLTRQKLNSPIGPTSQAANVDMPTFKSKIVNPLITTLIYAPYRLHLKRLLLHIPRDNKREFSSSADAPLSAKSSCANSSTNSSSAKSAMLNGTATISPKFVFVDEEENDNNND